MDVPHNNDILLTTKLLAVGKNAARVSSVLKVLPLAWKQEDSWPKVQRDSRGNIFFWGLTTAYVGGYATLSALVTLEAVSGGNNSVFDKAACSLTLIYDVMVVIVYVPVAIYPEEFSEVLRNTVKFSTDYCKKYVIPGSGKPKLIRIAEKIMTASQFLILANMSQYLIAKLTVLPRSGSITCFVSTRLTGQGLDVQQAKAIDFILLSYYVYIAWSAAVMVYAGIAYTIAPVIVLLKEIRGCKFSRKEIRNPLNSLQIFSQLRVLVNQFNGLYGIVFPAFQLAIMVQMVIAAYAGVKIGGALGGMLTLLGFCVLSIIVVLYIGLSCLGQSSKDIIQDWATRWRSLLILRKILGSQRPLWIRTPFYFVDKQFVLTMLHIVLSSIFNALLLGRK